MKKLNELVDCLYDIDILGVCDDSRNVCEGYLFVATKGYYVDHFDYITDAINKGAVAVISDRLVADISVPNIVVNDINDFYIDICSKFYNVSPDEFNFVGVTGTDGKTTTTSVISQIINKIYKCAYIGTNGSMINDNFFPTSNTTPCISELFQCLNFVKSNNCKEVVMEVSSEALLHKRLKNFRYDFAVFTNITEDHLNIHKTIDEYRKCKFKLLDLVKEDGLVIINGDDDNCRLIDCQNMYTVGVNLYNDFVISNVKENIKSVNFDICYKGTLYSINSPLLGLYNVYNVAMAFAVCLLKGISVDIIVTAIRNLTVIKGRREYLDFGQSYTIILDYAHTYNGIKSMLESVKKYRKIITVTGAAGGREKEKRPKIGKLILEKSDITIFTMDDPRYEDVNEIIDQLASDSMIEYLRIIDRKLAIYKAFELADDDTVVLILGKGRDNYMAVGDKKNPYCDYDVIKEYFA